jgi:hypothetical protein
MNEILNNIPQIVHLPYTFNGCLLRYTACPLVEQAADGTGSLES